jgi:RecA/RadA recombinase
MEGTRQSILEGITEWVTSSQGGNGVPQSNTYWIYGSPGIGKTSLAHSICANLYDQKRLAGAFFCRKDDPNLSEPRNILPTLIHRLTGIFPPFRSIVAERFHNDRNLTPMSMKHTLLLDFIAKLPRHPKHALVFVIDALDECGDEKSRSVLLKVLIDAAAQAPWLKVVITSRPEADIQRFFDAPTLPSHIRYDLATDQSASTDLQTFAQSQFDSVASTWYLPTPWPEKSLFDEVISRANGLFIFVKTIVLELEHYGDPAESLKAMLQDSPGSGSTSLYRLYSGILNARIVHSNATEFQRMTGVLLTTAQYRPLCEETIAELAGVRPNLIKKWVDDLSSLLYRDEGANREICVRHLSISDFFVSTACHHDYRVNLQDANRQLGVACLETMLKQLRFNICKLEDSRLANADVKDLPSRIKENISDALQYSSLYWSNHVRFTLNGDNQRMWGCLRKFFEGCYAVFWIELLSILGMLPLGVPSLRRIMPLAKVSTTPVRYEVVFQMILILTRKLIPPFIRELKMFVSSSLPSTPPFPPALHTHIFQQDRSCPHIRLY